MLVVTRMPGTIFGTSTAHGFTRAQLRDDSMILRAAKPKQQPAHGQATIGTILIRANALGEHSSVFFGQTGIGTGGADLGTLETGRNAFGIFLHIDLRRLWMCFQHLGNTHGKYLHGW